MAERPSIYAAMAPVEERVVATAAALDDALDSARGPLVFRGLVADWPLVAAGRQSARAARAHLLQFVRDLPFSVTLGQPGQSGRLFYSDDFKMNFQTARGQLADIFRGFDDNEGRTDAPAIYLTSVDMERFFDGLIAANPCPIADRQPLQSIWIGTDTRVAAHNDFPRNLACCAVGRRRFTIFPPDQFRNLYLGPLENTPAGRAISLVDFHDPDFDAHPRFAEALEVARYVELEPGDAVYIPSMWWHHVEGLEPFNILVNYWWRDTPGWLGQPQDALNHAIMAIRDLDAGDRAIWRDLFDYYVFNAGPETVAHIPPEARGMLGPLTPGIVSQIRAYLLRMLNR